ncbi:MAG: hypothetical protein DBY05_09720 [Clostridiales bacterium]|nr:MAG: hypothetical protein DBY05_09720 [Clostridiales bacterium]
MFFLPYYFNTFRAKIQGPRISFFNFYANFILFSIIEPRLLFINILTKNNVINKQKTFVFAFV